MVGQDQFIEGVKVSRSELKKKITTNDLSYEGCKTTYFQYRDQVQIRGVEVATFLRENYILYFDGTYADHKVSIAFYDKPEDDPQRIMLYEIQNISGKIKKVSMHEITEFYEAYGGNPEMLRSIYIDYIIKKGKPNRGAVSLALGY
ncbi:hypothetical protein CW751_07340 [Brumimicrobium salinarum]|uniref:Uncharacterized protein n=1 Tax=Brumimicrobium salinarum TaxID=2058658 RepID=A0A2I0R314_9FLAO|nr:hypothetical protein CW751_07340 [Brumimicrobium salinarum]